jgi:hypothetical protein
VAAPGVERHARLELEEVRAQPLELHGPEDVEVVRAATPASGCVP